MDLFRRKPSDAAVWAACLGGLVLLFVLYFSLPVDVFGPHRPVLRVTAFVLALVLLAWLLLRQILGVLLGTARGRPGFAIVATMCLSLVVFSTTYLGLAQDPGEFTGLRTKVDALYFTVVTMATVGFGDITPTGQAARLTVVLQIVYNLVFLTAGATALGQQVRGRLTDRIRGRAEGATHEG